MNKNKLCEVTEKLKSLKKRLQTNSTKKEMQIVSSLSPCPNPDTLIYAPTNICNSPNDATSLIEDIKLTQQKVSKLLAEINEKIKTC